MFGTNVIRTKLNRVEIYAHAHIPLENHRKLTPRIKKKKKEDNLKDVRSCNDRVINTVKVLHDQKMRRVAGQRFKLREILQEHI